MPDERIAVFDACVLVQAPLRDTLLRLAEAPDLYQPRWSDEIIAEMKRALQNQIRLAPAKIAYLERELRRHFGESWVMDFEPLVRKMTNDPKDRHVLAAAVRANAQSVVTFNRRHFPASATSPWGVEAVGPSTFLKVLYTRAPDVVIERLRQQAADLDRGMSEQLTVLAKAVPSFAELIRCDLGLGSR